MSGDQYYGAKASINVWAPRVANQYEFSLSQMWVISGSFGDDLNTIEAGWQACLYFLISSRIQFYSYYESFFSTINKHEYKIDKFYTSYKKC